MVGKSIVTGGEETPSRGIPSSLYAACLVAGFALVEPALGHLEKLGDTLEARQYLMIAPTGEVAYLFPALRSIRIRTLSAVSILLIAAGLLPGVWRLKKKGFDRYSMVGWILIVSGLLLMSAEYASKKEWVLFRLIGARYLALAAVAVGAFLSYRNRRYLAALGLGGFLWDLSSAVFWAVLKRSISATVPVPWRHHFDQEEGRGAPCWLVALLDSSAIAFFAWLARSDYDPLGLFED